MYQTISLGFKLSQTEPGWLICHLRPTVRFPSPTIVIVAQ